MKPGVGTTAALALAALSSGCRCESKSPETQRETVTPPYVSAPMKVDGEREEAAWATAFRSPPFENARGSHSPHTDVSILCGAEALYLMTYVADVDLRSTDDRIEMIIGRIKMQTTPNSTSSEGGISLAHDVDGTLDNPSDDDEEWIVETAIPWRLLGSKKTTLRIRRIDGGRGGPPHALAWPKEKEVVLDCTTSTKH